MTNLSLIRGVLVAAFLAMIAGGCQCGGPPPSWWVDGGLVPYPGVLPPTGVTPSSDPDSGITTNDSDAGVVVDADAGSVADAGDTSSPGDGGDVSDAGTTTDAGTTADDAGTVIDTDAGQGDQDAGSTACGGLTSIPSTGPVPAGCVRIDGSNVGLEASYAFGNQSLTITGWTPKPDEDGYFVGFSYESTAPIGFNVKCGTKDFYGDASPWLNPNGTTGSTAQAISNITVCPCQ